MCVCLDMKELDMDGIEWICVASFLDIKELDMDGIEWICVARFLYRLEDLLRQLPLCYVLFCR